jgi:hypothetical protein
MEKVKLLAVILLVAISSLSGFSASGTTAFMDHGFGARPLGMAEAYTAVADSPEAVLWNTAGLTQVGNQSLSSMYANVLNEARNLALFYTLPVENIGTLGFGLVSVYAENIEQFDVSGNSLGAFSYSDQLLMAGIARKILPDLSLSATFKYYQQTALSSNSATAFDIGMLLQRDNWKYGVVIENVLGGRLGVDPLPTAYRLGASCKLFPEENLTLALDLKFKEATVKTYFGAEYWVLPQMALRGGLAAGKVNLGLGLKWNKITCDYSLATTDLDNISRISLGMEF